WVAPWQAQLPLRLLDGRLGAQLRVEADPSGWAVHDATLHLAGLELHPLAAARDAADRLALASLEARGVDVHAANGSPPAAHVQGLRLDGLALQATRDERGQVAWQPRPS